VYDLIAGEESTPQRDSCGLVVCAIPSLRQILC
jgi:hypothetical protein